MHDANTKKNMLKVVPWLERILLTHLVLTHKQYKITNTLNALQRITAIKVMNFITESVK